MISKGEYEAAAAQKAAAEKVMAEYHRHNDAAFAERWAKFKAGDTFFSDDELIYSARARCNECRAGMAYPKACGIWHRWDCSACLKGSEKGHGSFPFNIYDIKSEDQPSAEGRTTRPAPVSPLGSEVIQ